MCNELSTYRCSEWRSPSVMAKPVDETRLSYTRVANKHHFENSFWCGGLTNRWHTCFAHVLLWVPERKILVKELDLFMCWLSTYKGCSTNRKFEKTNQHNSKEITTHYLLVQHEKAAHNWKISKDEYDNEMKQNNLITEIIGHFHINKTRCK